MGIDPKKLSELKKEIPYKYKPQSCKWGKATIVAYIDARDAQDLLDEVVGPENWQSDYKVVNNNMYGGVGINVKKDNGSEWVWKWDCGIESYAEKEKGESSDSFKRACVQWGIGRFLYRLGMFTLKATKNQQGKEVPCKDDGTILYGNDQITRYINERKSTKTINQNTSIKQPKYETPKEEPKYTTKHNYTAETIKRVSDIEKDGKKGKDCLNHFLSKFSEKENKSYTKLAELDDDNINKLMNFIEDQVPEAI